MEQKIRIVNLEEQISTRGQQIVSLWQQISSFWQEVSSLWSLQAAPTSSDKCTEFDWLRQDLPSWDSGNSKPPSATQRERMYTPVRVEYWDVESKVVAIACFVVNSTCEFVSKKRPDSSLTYAGEVNLEVPPEPLAEEGESTNTDGSKAAGRDVQKCFFYARPPHVDVLIRSNGIDPNCWCHTNISKGHARSILNCSLQVYEYLVLAKVGYGVLTDIQNWYLCKRDHGGCLYISTGFKLDDRKPPVSAAIAYLVNSAVDARGEFDVLPRKGERPWSWEVSPCASPSSGSKDGEDEDRTYKLNEREIGGYRTSPSRTRRGSSNATQNQLQEVPAPDLHLDDRPISTGGWSGCVVGGTLIGCRVAVKLALRNSERAEALLNEVDAYLKLQKYWGEFVPH
ncbi:uncharacterized protein [Physcomitrium patens]|uniref:uncharacterized protein n=1 Tax=Physcomitrium patens TaxID=3218 RepID=UPI003CCD8FF0